MQSEIRHQFLFLTPDTSIDGASAIDLIEQVRLALDDGCRDIILDLHNAPYIAAAGLKAILDIATMMKNSDGHLLLASLHGQSQEIMEASGLGRILLQFDTAAEAESYAHGLRPHYPTTSADDEDEDEDEDEEDPIFDDE
ncbi:STAS domain-containing protein [Noviherbaspirillum pedocola]|uniref:STAS domain-containing protein n=1 Tax=Noviherbaspirillum pedocola TaxID=2801341 RepID=A0A934W677_9BURK|nr:STAS domain-containing protein [Noviherbaspirillum pedocola]MBK4733224.1 STAS domain-containing protein [Noviherbaspirillum pedocola]